MLGALRGFPAFTREQAAARWAYQGDRPAGDQDGADRRLRGDRRRGGAAAGRVRGDGRCGWRAAPGPGVAGLDDLPAPAAARPTWSCCWSRLTPQTAGMVDGAFLAAMKDGALLVNAARGTVVDTAALVAEVASGRLRAALDVTAPEPLPPGHPLWTLPGAFITPARGRVHPGVTAARRPAGAGAGRGVRARRAAPERDQRRVLAAAVLEMCGGSLLHAISADGGQCPVFALVSRWKPFLNRSVISGT